MSKIITPAVLKKMLSEGPTRFSFVKTNGTLREAYGTTNLGEIPSASHPRGGSAPNETVTFFDLEISEWRALSVHSEIRIP